MEKEQLDNNFGNILKEKQKVLEQKYSDEDLNKINLRQLLFIGNYLDNLKPKSKVRKYKEFLLNYLNQFIYINIELNDEEITFKKKEHLEPLISFLRKYHNFYTNNLLIYVRTTLGLVLDLILIFFGIGEHYYYVPIFMIVFFIFSLRKHNKLKKEGKILRL